MASPDPITEFMDGLGVRAHDPALAKATGTVRFEVVDGARTERWLLTVSKGELAVSRRNDHADVVLRAPRALFEQLVQGRMNATAAFLRGALRVEGDVELIVLVKRLLPGPPAPRRKSGKTGSAAGRR